jgi:hypothetical protein
MATSVKYYSIDIITKYFATMQQKESVSEKSSPLRTSKYFLYLFVLGIIMQYFFLSTLDNTSDYRYDGFVKNGRYNGVDIICCGKYYFYLTNWPTDSNKSE